MLTFVAPEPGTGIRPSLPPSAFPTLRIRSACINDNGRSEVKIVQRPQENKGVGAAARV